MLSMIAGLPVFGNGIKAAGMPRMASEQSPQTHVAPLQESVSVDRFEGVLRAAGIEAAMASEKWADQQLVRTDDQSDEPAHTIFRSLER
jgi:hypothetical protein